VKQCNGISRRSHRARASRATSLDVTMRVRYSPREAMEFAVCSESVRDRKPRELMTPSEYEGVFLCSVIFW